MQFCCLFAFALAFVLVLVIPVNVLLTPGQHVNWNANPGEPLFLTPYIRNGLAKEARNLSLVGPIKGMENIVSYSGFLTVDPDYNSYHFFWFFPALNNSKAAPVILWLAGGPGCSAMFAVFEEIGPYLVNEELLLVKNNYTWITNYNMLFIENPVGTGFAFTDSEDGYSKSEDDVTRNLYNALCQFYILFHDYVDNDFYIAGESYAGKYVPALANKIHERNNDVSFRFNLKGVAIGDGLIDPITQMDFGDFLYNIRLIDEKQLEIFQKLHDKMAAHIRKDELEEAFEISYQMILERSNTYFNFFTGLETDLIYNYLGDIRGETRSNWDLFVQIPEVRKAIHIGNQQFRVTNGISTPVYSHMTRDIMNSSKPWLESLIDNGYQVMLFNGQLDILVAYQMTLKMIASMRWKTKDDYLAASRLIWKVDPNDSNAAGYARPSHNFVEVLVRDAGHCVLCDQPRAALDLIDRFINGKPWVS